jgi:hypothetical protein
MNRADSKLLATTVADLLVTYGWCVLIPSEEGIEISNMDNVYLYADNDRVRLYTYAQVHHQVLF